MVLRMLCTQWSVINIEVLELTTYFSIIAISRQCGDSIMLRTLFTGVGAEGKVEARGSVCNYLRA